MEAAPQTYIENNDELSSGTLKKTMITASEFQTPRQKKADM